MQCTEGSEGSSLIFVPSFGKVIKKENTRPQLATNISEVMKVQSVSKYLPNEYMVTSIEVVCKDMKKAVYVL